MRLRLTRKILEQLQSVVRDGAQNSWALTITPKGRFVISKIPDPIDSYPYSGSKKGSTVCLHRYSSDPNGLNEDLENLGEQIGGIDPAADWWMVLHAKDDLCQRDRIVFVRFDESRHDVTFLHRLETALKDGLAGVYAFSGEFRVVVTN